MSEPTTVAEWLDRARSCAEQHHDAHCNYAQALKQAGQYAQIAAETAADMKGAIAEAERLLAEETQ